MACCGKDEDEKQHGIVQQRKCRDILCLLLFVAFWVGMFIILGFAAKSGNTNRLLYGVDSYGLTCGSKNSYNNTDFDFSDRKNLHFLNSLDLLSVVNIPFAKTVCVDGCPDASNVCNAPGGLPCTQNAQYQCPYYFFAPPPINGSIPNVQPDNTVWFSALTTMPPVRDPNASATIQRLQSLNIPWINTWLTTNNISAGSGTVGGAYYQLTSQVPGQGPCYPILVPTASIFNRCFPKFPDNWTQSVVQSGLGPVAKEAGDQFNEWFNSASAQWTRYVASISKGILIIIVGGVCGGVALSLFWMIVLRYLAGIMMYLTVLLVNVAMVGMTLFSFSYAGFLGSSGVGKAIADVIPSDPTNTDRTVWKWIAIALAIIAGIILIVSLLSISRIRIAAACIKVTSQAVGSMPSILIFPLIPFVLEVALIVYWISVTALLYSAGDLTANCRNGTTTPYTFSQLQSFYNGTSAPSGNTGTFECFQNASSDARASLCGSDPNCYLSYNWNNKLKYAFIYHFFGLLWTNQVIIGITCVTIAGAIGAYYWSGGNKSEMPRFPVWIALRNALIFHLGSIAFGAFIIAVIQLIRFILEYIDRKTRTLQEENVALKWTLCCIKCCMWCLEKIMAFINRNAYVLIGVKGSNYCVSAMRAVQLIVANAFRLAVINIVGDLLLFLAKVTVAAACGCIAFAMSTLPYYTDPGKHPQTYIVSPVLPIAISVITGFVIAQIFFAVYEMGIDTVILAFCEDCEENGGNPRYAPPLLLEVMGSEAPDQHVTNTVKPMSG